MGLCMNVEKTDEDFFIGYVRYFWLRVEILESIDYFLAKDFKNTLNEVPISEKSFEKLYNLGLHEFMLHSDCDGILELNVIEKTLKALNKVKLFKNSDFKKEFKGLKDILSKAVKSKSNIIYC
jgi:hypothetical protein